MRRLARLAKKGYRAGRHIQRFGQQVIENEHNLEYARQQLITAHALVNPPTLLTAAKRVQVAEAIQEGIDALGTLQSGLQAAKRRMGA